MTGGSHKLPTIFCAYSPFGRLRTTGYRFCLAPRYSLCGRFSDFQHHESACGGSYPIMMAVGVDSPSAQGQAAIASTETDESRACVRAFRYTGALLP